MILRDTTCKIRCISNGNIYGSTLGTSSRSLDDHWAFLIPEILHDLSQVTRYTSIQLYKAALPVTYYNEMEQRKIDQLRNRIFASHWVFCLSESFYSPWRNLLRFEKSKHIVFCCERFHGIRSITTQCVLRKR